MSIRSSSSVTVVDGLSNNMFGSAPAGFAAGDRLIFVISQDLASSVFTSPGGEGWASIGRADNTIDGQSMEVFEIKSASGSETFQFTSSTQKRAIIQVYAFTGRHATNAAVVSTPTISNASNATPISVALTGLTASTGSDVLWLAGLDQLDGADIWSFSGLSGYTVEQNVSSGDWITLSGWIKESVSSGATGTLTATATRSSGSSTAGFAGIVIALPVTSGPNLDLANVVKEPQAPGATITVTKPPSVSNGDYWFVHITSDTPTTTTLPTGWVRIDSRRTSADQSLDIVYRIIDSSEGSTETFSVSGGATKTTQSFKGTGINAINTANGSNGPGGVVNPFNATGAAITTTQNNCLLVWAGCGDTSTGGATTWTAPSGYTDLTQYSDGAWNTQALATKTQATAGAESAATGVCTGIGGEGFGIQYALEPSGSSPTVSTVSSNNANEGTSIVHTVTLSAAVSGSAAVYAITLAGGTATGGGTDYTNTLTNGMFSNSVTVSGGNITVPIGVSSFTVTIPTTTDALVEGAETYTLTIGGTAGTGTINDLVVFTVNSVDLGSFTGFATFTVTASATSGVDRDIVCTTSNGTAAAGVDYTATTQTVTILAGNLTADFLVPIINTRKPDTDLVTTGWTVTGAADHSAALADNSDASYTTSPDAGSTPGPLKTQMLPTPLAAGTHTRQIRASYDNAPCDVRLSLLNSSDVSQGDSGWVSLTASIADYTLAITTTGSSTRFLFEVRATP